MATLAELARMHTRLDGPALAKGGGDGESGATSTAALSTGVLTGNAPTNNSAEAVGTFGLRDEATATASTTLLEIRVVAPAN